VAELRLGDGARAIPRDALVHQILDSTFDMKRELVVDLAIDPPAGRRHRAPMARHARSPVVASPGIVRRHSPLPGCCPGCTIYLSCDLSTRCEQGMCSARAQHGADTRTLQPATCNRTAVSHVRRPITLSTGTVRAAIHPVRNRGALPPALG